MLYEAGLVAAAAAGLVAKVYVIGPHRLAALWSACAKGLVLAPLFSRIPDDSLLDNPTRRAVRDYVAGHPGSTIQAVRAGLGVAWGTAVYHLERLERSGQLVSSRSGHGHRYFVAGTREARRRDAMSVLKGPTTLALAKAIASEPGLPQQAHCRRLGIAAPTASKHLRRLERAGLISFERRDRYLLCHPAPGLAESLALVPEAVPPAGVPAALPEADLPEAIPGVETHGAPLSGELEAPTVGAGRP